MKIIILHGEDVNKSYDRLKRFIETAKSRSWEVAFIDDAPGSLQENLSTNSLFGAERFFILRDVKKLGKKEFEWLNKKYGELSGNFIIYHEGVLGQTFLKNLPKEAKIEEYKLPKLIWSFLESMRPGSSVSSVKLFHKIIEKDAPELVFSLMFRQFRDLYWSKVDPKSMQIPSWRLQKLKAQSSHFSQEQLEEIVSRFVEIDVSVKSGQEDLVSSLDLFIIKQLE